MPPKLLPRVEIWTSLHTPEALLGCGELGKSGSFAAFYLELPWNCRNIFLTLSDDQRSPRGLNHVRNLASKLMKEVLKTGPRPREEDL